MNRLTGSITKHKKMIVAVFLVLTALCGVLSFFNVTNENMIDYLPDDAQSTVALEIMQAEFSGALPNASVMVPNVSLTQALAFKETLKGIEGVSAVTWLDDVLDLKTPVEMADPSLVAAYYKENNALFSVAITDGYEADAVNAIYEQFGEDIAVTGEAANIAYGESLGSSEGMGAMLVLVPLILLVLFLTTTSWIEPLLYVGAIGVAIVINVGLTVFSGEVSYVTMTVSPILQLAVSLDYSIFLLHSFENFRKTEPDPAVAMQRAMRASFSSIAASAATTLFGFVALLFMRFEIGPDLGFHLVKGILLSYISVMVFLPALTLCVYKLLDKTRHRRILPTGKRVGRALLKIRIPALLLALVVIVPCFLAQSRNSFIYGNGEPTVSSRYGADTQKINAVFGRQTNLVILVPKGDTAKETALCEELGELQNVTGVTAYVTTVGAQIPEEYLSSSITGNFYSEHYARIILTCDTAEEGQAAFALVEAVQDVTARYYDTFYTCGQSANLYDLKEVVSADNTLVNLIAVVAIFLVLLLTFRSATLPFLLLTVIESAIWINLSVPYFAGDSLSYIGYLVINTVQLGATIDYAILLTNSYLQNRKTAGKKQAMEAALRKNLLSILVSAITLAGAGLCLYFISSNSIVSALGLLLGRGTALSFLLVVCVLPALLLLFDPIIGKTTFKARFFKGGAKK